MLAYDVDINDTGVVAIVYGRFVAWCKCALTLTVNRCHGPKSDAVQSSPVPSRRTRNKNRCWECRLPLMMSERLAGIDFDLVRVQ